MNPHTDSMSINGIHHITAIADSAAENHRFYTGVLGLRMVKQTVNFDDPNTYHLYYGDDNGSPGTLITFFPWEAMPRGRQGTGQITAVAFAIVPDSVDYWKRRLSAFRIKNRLETRFGEPVIRFLDPHGMPVELVATSGTATVQPWSKSPVPSNHLIRGFHSATATLRSLATTRELLTDILGMTPAGKEGDRHRFYMGNGAGVASIFDIVVAPDVSPGRMGGGTVHHIAWRTPSVESQRYWQSAVQRHGLSVTPIIDRNYFQSIYFREAGGVLFEIATDPPGFAVDEAPADLGSNLMLPSQYESRRAEIKSQLPRLNETVELTHSVDGPQAGDAYGSTLVTLHGTGGDERDLFPLARQIAGKNATLLGLRGKVSENGMPRFFRRLAEGVFDEADVRHRAFEVADFLRSAVESRDLNPQMLTALGYSNGANMAAAVMLLRPEVFRQAILLRPMLPLADTLDVDLTGVRVLITTGRADRIIPAKSSQALIRQLQESGAEVTAVELDADHGLIDEDIAISRRWLASSTLDRTAGIMPENDMIDIEITA